LNGAADRRAISIGSPPGLPGGAGRAMGSGEFVIRARFVERDYE